MDFFLDRRRVCCRNFRPCNLFVGHAVITQAGIVNLTLKGGASMPKPIPSGLKKRIEDHKLWLESQGAHGHRAVLNRFDLSDLDLQGVKLEGADLQGADMTRTQLRAAHLAGAEMSGCCLENAGLQWANLAGANMSGARMVGAQLQFTNFSGAVLTSAS